MYLIKDMSSSATQVHVCNIHSSISQLKTVISHISNRRMDKCVSLSYTHSLSFCVCVHVRVYVYATCLCVYVFVQVCMLYMYKHAEASDQSWFTLIFETASFTGLEIIKQPRLVGQQAPGMHLFTPLQCWDAKYAPACPDFFVHYVYVYSLHCFWDWAQILIFVLIYWLKYT